MWNALIFIGLCITQYSRCCSAACPLAGATCRHAELYCPQYRYRYCLLTRGTTQLPYQGGAAAAAPLQPPLPACRAGCLATTAAPATAAHTTQQLPPPRSRRSSALLPFATLCFNLYIDCFCAHGAAAATARSPPPRHKASKGGRALSDAGHVKVSSCKQVKLHTVTHYAQCCCWLPAPTRIAAAAVGRGRAQECGRAIAVAANKNARYRDEYLLTHARKHNLVNIMKLQPACRCARHWLSCCCIALVHFCQAVGRRPRAAADWQCSIPGSIFTPTSIKLRLGGCPHTTP